jgi:very-short-patch-repair endonuclease
MSLPEVLLWQRLRGKQGGLKVRRQHPIGPYVADFYCSATRLVIEIDGSVHDAPDRVDRDLVRQRFMEENGYNVLRVLASDVLKDVDATAEAIVRAASPLHHRPAAGGPPPRAGEDLV